MHKNNEINSSDLIDQIKNNAELQLDIIQRFIPEAIPNKKFKLHDEKTPSSSLKLHEGKYWIKDFGGSDKAKDCFNIAQEALGCDMPELLIYLKSNFSVDSLSLPSENKSTRTAFEKQVYAIKCNPKLEVTQYLKGRDIDTDNISNDAFYQNNNINGVADALVFFDRDEKFINKRFLNATDSQRYSNKGRLDGVIYDICFKPDSEKVFIVEGAINSLSLLGMESSIALFSAANNITANRLKNYITNKHVLLALDNDKAGNQACEKLYGSILESNIDILSIKRCLFPLNKDCNNLLCKDKLKAFISDKNNYKQLFPEFIPDSENENKEIEEYGFFKRNSCYYVQDNIKGKPRERRISNFLMKSIYFMSDGMEEAKRIFFFQNRLGEAKYVSIPYDKMNIKNFKAIGFKGGGFSFKGSEANLDLILESIVETRNTIYEIDMLGYQTKYDVYAFSNGVIDNGRFVKVDRLGVAKLKNANIYLPAFNFMNKNSPAYVNERRFVYREGNFDFEQWSQLFLDAYQEKAIVGICYVIGAIFRDVVFNELGFFPYLFLFGDYGVGKTTFSELILNLFGSGIKGISLEAGSTSKSVARSGSQVRNSIVYLKELTNQIEGKIQGFLKTGYEGVGYSRAQTDNSNKTHDIFLNSALMLDGNHLPNKSSAMYSRMITLSFSNHQFTELETNAFNKLKAQEKFGFGKVLFEIHNHRKYFEAKFSKYFKQIYPKLKYENSETNDFSERNIKHMTILLSIYKTMADKLKFPISYADIFTMVLNIAKEQDEGLKRINEVNQFWQAVEFLKVEEKITSKHYRIIQKDGKNYVAMIYKLVYPFYKKFCLNQNQSDLDQNTLLALLKDQKSFVSSWQKNRTDTVTIKGFGSAYVFDFKLLPLEKEIWLK
jgi:5S rRNA maturation endonuclease (ribonuclease M5)